MKREDNERMKTPLVALLGSALYATVRYNIFKGVPWDDWPLYTLNKVFALSSLFLLLFSVISKRSAKGYSNIRDLYMASVFAAMHVMLSFVLLSPVYYEKFFLEGELTASAGLSMLLGAVATVAIVVDLTIHGNRNTKERIRYLGLLAFMIGLHALLQGFEGWFAPLTWPGMMPPITLISFLFGLAAVSIALYPKGLDQS
jgi:hypothetical protein